MKKMFDKCRDGLAFCAALLFMLIFVLVILEILCRTFFGFSILWLTDFIQLVVCWTLAFGMSAIVYTNDHLKIDFIKTKLPLSMQKYLELLTDLVEFGFFVMLVPYGIKTAMTKMSILFTTLRWPMGYMYAALPVFGALCAFFMISRLSDDISKLKTRR